MAESKQNLEKVTEEAAVLESRQQALNSDVEKLKTPEGVEEEVRKKFSVVKDGEQMVVLLDDKTASSAPPQPKPGFWKRVWNIVTGGIFRGGDDASTTGTVSETGNVPAE